MRTSSPGSIDSIRCCCCLLPLPLRPDQDEPQQHEHGDDQDQGSTSVYSSSGPPASRASASALKASKSPRSIAARAPAVSLSTNHRLCRLSSRSPRISCWLTRWRTYAREKRAAGRALAALLERARIAGEAGVAEVQPARSRERRAGAGGARRQDAVEHVDPPRDTSRIPSASPMPMK